MGSSERHPLVARRMQDVQMPIIPWVGDLIRRTPGTISLGQGVVDYPPPAAAHQALVRFCEEPARHKYQHELGIPELRERIVARLAAENGIDAGRYSLMVTAGGNMAFLTALLAICDRGDEVVLVRPWFFNHEMAVRIIGCRPVVVAANEHYQLDLAAIEAAVGPRTRAVVTVSPNNPSGAVYPESDLRAVNALCAARGLYHVSDEVYEYFLFDGARHFSPGAIAGAEAHTVCIYSLSKSYGFASWRVGYMLFPSPLLEAVKKIQDTNVICAPAVSARGGGGARRRAGVGRGAVEVDRGGAPHCPRCAVEPGRSRDGAASGRGLLLPRPGAPGRGFGGPRRTPDPATPHRGDTGHGVRNGRRLLPAHRLWRGGRGGDGGGNGAARGRNHRARSQVTVRTASRRVAGDTGTDTAQVRRPITDVPLRKDTFAGRSIVHARASRCPVNESCRHAS